MSLSVKFNGIELNEYIDVAQGFTPFSGANWEPEMSKYGGSMRGGNFAYTTYKSKRIDMPFVMKYNLSEKYDELQRILNVNEPKMLIFGNTSDRFAYAVPFGTLDFEEIVFLGKGTITWIIPDGLSHSTVEKTFPASLNAGVMEANIINNGTESVPVDYTIKHNHENGFIGIVSEHGTIQLGYKNEPDKQQHTKSQVLLDYRSAAAFNAMTNGQGIFGYNYGKNGTWRTVNKNGKQLIAMDAIGSGDSWHGASKMVTIPNDSYGVSGSSEFYIQGKIWFETGKTRQTGMIAMSVGDENGQHLAGIRIAKWDLGKNIAEAIFDIQGTELKRVSFIPAWDGPTNSEKGQIYIKKSGSLFEFYFGGGKYQFRYPSAGSKKAKTVSIFIGQGSDLPSSLLVSIMCWEYVFFRKENVNYWVDIPNRYNGNSTVFIDGSATEVFVDGIIRYEDEMVGSDYFHVPPGETKVQFFYSDFSNPPPTITAKIREAYL